ncbi:nicotinamide N-methyltransferase-like [Lethenteron reissneri]|uniref:nicotinamide N-methyltransferase-like n=1 Tax=Lethenteron reissneri TaxID=7753 RepID=UPI002AB7EC20|nr:nicotinamide N-methyltransferase-like [Lethenteron reissneri]
MSFKHLATHRFCHHHHRCHHLTLSTIMEGQNVAKRYGQDYATHFKAREYLDTYYNTTPEDSPKRDFFPELLQFLHSTFNNGEIRGQRLLDVGSGPTIHQVLSASEWFPEIYLSDYAQSNREELQSWLCRSPDAFDWTKTIEFVCRLEGHRKTVEEKSVHVRKAVRAVLPCDVNQEDPLLGSWSQGPFDCIISTLCFEAACRSIGDFTAALGHVCRLLRPGGWFILATELGETFYHMGSEIFHVLSLDETVIRQVVGDAGLIIQQLELHLAPKPSPDDVNDHQALLFLRAQKKM